MYHINPARIKSILQTMPDNELLRHIRYIRRQMHKLPEGNRQTMFLNLYTWAFYHCWSKRPQLMEIFLE